MFNNYLNYSNVKEVNIPIDQNLLNDASILADSIIAAVHKCKDIRVTLKFMKRSKKLMTFFLFLMLTPITTLKGLISKSNIPVKIIKTNSLFENFI